MPLMMERALSSPGATNGEARARYGGGSSVRRDATTWFVWRPAQLEAPRNCHPDNRAELTTGDDRGGTAQRRCRQLNARVQEVVSKGGRAPADISRSCQLNHRSVR